MGLLLAFERRLGVTAAYAVLVVGGGVLGARM